MLSRLAFAFLPCASFAAPADQRVTKLPGWSSELFSATYSGYISAGHEDGYTMHEHYLFFESEGNPRTDPLILWTNGGPGAASLFGAFTELGPYFLSGDSLNSEDFRKTGVPTLFENKFRWTKFGSLLILNSPPPVGFSYCDPAGPSGSGTSCGSWNDTKTANHNLEFLKNWFKVFPEYAKQDLYLIGESYAGVYVPTLARAILEDGSHGPAAQLKGFAVGDPCLGGSAGCVPWQGRGFEAKFFYGHGQFSTLTYEAIQKQCSEEELLNGATSNGCQKAFEKMDKEKGYAFEYGLYDECYDFDLSRGSVKRRLATGPSSYVPHHMDGSPCGGTNALARWVNASSVRKALHVAEDSFFFDADNGEGFVYNQTEPSLIPFYQHVASNTSLRVMVYNGDADPSLNSFLAEYWTRLVGLPEVEAWRPWTIDGKLRMGGFVTRYKGDFDFLTIRGSGHMVPTYKPEAAFTFIKAWLSNEEFPGLHPKQHEVRGDMVV